MISHDHSVCPAIHKQAKTQPQAASSWSWGRLAGSMTAVLLFFT